MALRYGTSFCLGLALAAAACGREAPRARNELGGNGAITVATSPVEIGSAANAAAPAAPAADIEGARALVDRIYMPYTRGEIPRSEPPYTPELRAAIARQSDDETGLGFDPFCQCQDFDDFRYTIESIEPDEEGLQAQVAIRNFSERPTVTLVLRRRGATWLVHDIIGNNGGLLAGR